MFKPVELTTRLMAASINRLSNALPFFPLQQKPPGFQKLSLLGFWNGLFQLLGGPSLTWIATSHSSLKGQVD
jgi:hypothetical protein